MAWRKPGGLNPVLQEEAWRARTQKGADSVSAGLNGGDAESRWGDFHRRVTGSGNDLPSAAASVRSIARNE